MNRHPDWSSRQTSVASDISTFVNGATRYFETTASQSAAVGAPYVAESERATVQEFTGLIRIAGERKGIVYFTAPRSMLSVMLLRMGETDLSDDNMRDLVGEVANTISGNARREIGQHLKISVPTVVTNLKGRIDYPVNARPVVIPVHWRSYSAQLVVCLQ
jgi:chemotaxis protein CheX